MDEISSSMQTSNKRPLFAPENHVVGCQSLDCTLFAPCLFLPVAAGTLLTRSPPIIAVFSILFPKKSFKTVEIVRYITTESVSVFWMKTLIGYKMEIRNY